MRRAIIMHVKKVIIISESLDGATIQSYPIFYEVTNFMSYETDPQKPFSKKPMIPS